MATRLLLHLVHLLQTTIVNPAHQTGKLLEILQSRVCSSGIVEVHSSHSHRCRLFNGPCDRDASHKDYDFSSTQDNYETGFDIQGATFQKLVRERVNDVFRMPDFVIFFYLCKATPWT